MRAFLDFQLVQSTAMNKIIISREFDPAYNLSLEEELLRTIGESETVLFLWQNEKTVVIGRNQNPFSECNLSYMKNNDVKLVRRISGGGAVFHDLGNLNFTFVTKEANENLDKQLKVIIDAMDTLGLKATVSGRNDLAIDGRKFSGHAFYYEDGNYFHHGTLMININLENLSKSLNVSKLKLESKGIKSVKSRVINLSNLNKDIDIESVKSALVNSFINLYGNVNRILEYDKSNKKPESYDKYTDDKWNFGECPEFTITLEEKLSLGNFEIKLNVDSGLIKDCKLFTDSLIDIDFKKIEMEIIGLEFSEDAVMEFIEEKIK